MKLVPLIFVDLDDPVTLAGASIGNKHAKAIYIDLAVWKSVLVQYSSPIVANPGVVSGSGFFAEPFGSYTANYIADTTFGGAAGTSTTVAWNNSTITGPTYSTLQAAIDAAALNYVNTSTPSRVCVLAGQTHATGGTPFHIASNTGTVATALKPFVIQGDPAATAATMPKVDSASNVEGGFAIGSAPAGSSYGGHNDNSNTVVRKLDVTGSVSTGGAVYGFALGALGGARYEGLVVEFCKVHKIRYSLTGGAGGSGPFYTFDRNTSDHFEIRYCKLYDTIATDGTTGGKPFSAIETYGGVFNIHHNEIYECPTAFSGKTLTPTTPNGSIHHNLIHDCGNNGSGIIEGEAGGSAPGYNGVAIHHNLFYWTHSNDTVFGTPGSNSLWNDTGANGNTTQPTNIQFYNNTFDAAIGSNSSFTLWNHFTTNFEWHDNIALGSVPVCVSSYADGGTFINVDHNVYFNPAHFYLNFSVAPVEAASFTAWQSAHTTNPSYTGLVADPDAHGINIGALSAPWNTIAANFPNSGTYDYTIAAGSPLKGSGTGGADPGYNPADIGPGW